MYYQLCVRPEDHWSRPREIQVQIQARLVNRSSANAGSTNPMSAEGVIPGTPKRHIDVKDI